jgi:hypothetical protein
LPGELPPRGRSIQAGSLCYTNGRTVDLVARLDARTHFKRSKEERVRRRIGNIEPKTVFHQAPSGQITGNRRRAFKDLTVHYPQRWHVEEFFKFNQALGWQRAGTLNLNIRYGQMSMALLAQAAIHQMRQRLGQPFGQWDATHLAREIFGALEGDVRVTDDTILVTYYNAPHQERLRQHYEHLPDKLQQEGIEPTLPWLYGFKLDFRFR